MHAGLRRPLRPGLRRPDAALGGRREPRRHHGRRRRRRPGQLGRLRGRRDLRGRRGRRHQGRAHRDRDGAPFGASGATGGDHEARPRRPDVPPHPRGDRAARRRRPRRLLSGWSSRRRRTSSRSSPTPGSTPPTVATLRRRAADAGVGISSVLPVLRWSGPGEDARQAAVRAWRRAIQITVDLGVDTMNTEFNGRPEAAEHAEAMFLRSFDELAPGLRARGHPAGARAAPRRLHRGRPRRGRHGRGPRPGLGLVPLLHAAHVPPGQRRRRHHRPRRRTG